MSFIRDLFKRVRGGARRILNDSDRFEMIEVGVRFVLLGADKDITDAELDDLKRRADSAITAARSSVEEVK